MTTASAINQAIDTWRAQALFRAVGPLLSEAGCSFSAEALAPRVGVPKGSLRVTRAMVTDAIARALDRRVERMPLAEHGEDAFRSACEALLRPDAEGRTAIPCCLSTSPCPQDWTTRWTKLAPKLGLGSSGLAMLLGEALQAIAASPPVRLLIEQGRTDEAVERVLAYFDEE